MKGCSFCHKKRMKKFIVDKDASSEEYWYAFVPRDPEIFGHVILTTDKGGCIQDLYKVDESILTAEIVGVRQTMEKLWKMRNVGRVYVVVAGESEEVHHHFHLLPRYEFKNTEEREKWAEEYCLDAEDPKWVEFFKWPTLNFEHKEGFQYLGEIERKYNQCKNNEYYPNRPSEGLRLDMVGKVNAIFGG